MSTIRKCLLNDFASAFITIVPSLCHAATGSALRVTAPRMVRSANISARILATPVTGDWQLRRRPHLHTTSLKAAGSTPPRPQLSRIIPTAAFRLLTRNPRPLLDLALQRSPPSPRPPRFPSPRPGNLVTRLHPPPPHRTPATDPPIYSCTARVTGTPGRWPPFRRHRAPATPFPTRHFICAGIVVVARQPDKTATAATHTHPIGHHCCSRAPRPRPCGVVCAARQPGLRPPYPLFRPRPALPTTRHKQQ